MSVITILGAGVAGLAVATELTARGAQVQIHDPAGAPGAHQCSWWAGGMLAPFCEYENAEEPVLRLGQEAIGWWSERTALTRHGTLVVAHERDQPDMTRFARRTEGHRFIGNEELTCLEPDLPGFTSGLYFADEAHLRPRQALDDLYSALQAGGVQVLESAPTEPEGWVVDCRGLAARADLDGLRGVKGEMLLIRCPDVQITRPVRLLHPRIPLYVVPRGDGVYMLGATMIESEDRRGITARSMLELLSAAFALNPAFGEAEILETGVDLRPAFADNLPRIRRRGRRVWANGLYRHGYLLAPALARGVAALILDDQTPEFCDENHP